MVDPLQAGTIESTAKSFEYSVVVQLTLTGKMVIDAGGVYAYFSDPSKWGKNKYFCRRCKNPSAAFLQQLLKRNGSGMDICTSFQLKKLVTCLPVRR